MKRVRSSSSSSIGRGDRQNDNITNKKKKKDKRNTFESVFSVENDLHQNVVAYLPWKDQMMLGAVDQQRRATYLARQDEILEPVLDVLEGVFRQRPGFEAVDPRDDDSYEMWPIHRKIARMVHFLSTIVANMRPHLNFADPSNPRHIPVEIASIRLYPRRAAFNFNFYLIMAASFQFYEGDELWDCFYQAILGNGGIDWLSHDFGQFMSIIVRSACFENGLEDRVVDYIYENLTDGETLLGPGLFARVILAAPLLDWIDDAGEVVGFGDLEPVLV